MELLISQDTMDVSDYLGTVSTIKSKTQWMSCNETMGKYTGDKGTFEDKPE
jgi:hypothetical protein